jgi:hypothetical protein
MHKSALTFGFLMSSLVILAVVPFLNNNAAMTQEYDKYEDSSYSQYPTGDKPYECQTGPFEGFFVGSVEFCKNVKFGDINDVEDGNGVGGDFCILESLEGCFQQHVDKSKLETIKELFEDGVEFSTYVFGPDLIEQRVTFSSFEDICLILNTIPTTGGEFNASVYRILVELPLLEPFTDEFINLWDCILDAEPIF